MKIEVVITDISTQPDMQAVVNSANSNLRMGSGVAGAIHGAAGPKLEAYCRQFAPLAAGKAVLTPGFDLPNAWVIHAVAASFINEPQAEFILAKALDSVMKLVNEHRIESLAIPAIGTGVFKCKPELSAELTAQVLAYYQKHGTSLKHIRICVSTKALKEVFEQALKANMGAEVQWNGKPG
ncbi:MAG: macro domain-containing protein [Rhodoferax sp.]|nr:macro domain-containing protein [Rhodoferax sp.]